MSIFRRQQGFFPLFLLAAAKSALRNLTVKMSCVADFAVLSDEKFNGTSDMLSTIYFHLLVTVSV